MTQLLAGVAIGGLGASYLTWRLWWLVDARPWRPVVRAYRRLLADIGRALLTGRWT